MDEPMFSAVAQDFQPYVNIFDKLYVNETKHAGLSCTGSNINQ